MRYPLLSGALGALLLGPALACNKINFGPDEGYTARDASNQPVGSTDATDWTSDKDWKKIEKRLFDGLGVDLDQPQTGGVGQLGLYPNPATEMVAFYVDAAIRNNPGTAPALKMKAIIVDKKFRKTQEFELATRGGSTVSQFMLRPDKPKFKSGQLYRLYYVFYDEASKQLYLKGHGDIKVID